MMPTPVRPVRSPSQRVFGVLLGLLAVLLPGLVAGVQIGHPASESERERIAEAIAAEATPSQPATLAARALYTATLDDAAASFAAEPERTVVRARIGVLWLTFALGGLLYMLLATSRGGLSALLACLVFATLPPVLDEGYVLRPEPLACAFGLLGTVLLATYASMVLLHRRRARWRRAVLFVALAALTGAAYGVSAAALSRASVLFLVPAGVVTLACAVQVSAWIALARRRRLTRATLTRLARRSWPWFCLAAVVMVASGAVLYALGKSGVAATPASASLHGVLPRAWPRAALLVVLMVVGGLRLLLECGIELGARRLRPGVVLLLFCAVALMQQWLVGTGQAALVAACAAAALAGEGATTVLVVLVGALLLRAQARRRQAQQDGR